MSDSIKFPRQQGVTLVELLVVITVLGLLIVPVTAIVVNFYGDSLRNNVHSRLAVESQTLLRTMVEELRVSSGVRANNLINDNNSPGGGWTTANSNLVLIITMPALDTSNNFIIDPLTGGPYHNEIVYFAQGNTLYKRYLAHPDASGNRLKTSCPSISASTTCPEDVKLSEHFKDMVFTFYDQDNSVTTTLSDARSIYLNINVERKAFGKAINFSNSIRITMRNAL